nr:MAG TPA: hypothetical protein [Caudoviricetes sp.]
MKNRVPRPLSHGDIQFIKLLFDGKPRVEAFREAYPDNKVVQRWHATRPLPMDSRERRRATDTLKDSAQWKVNSKHIRKAIMTYQAKMDHLAELSLKVAEDLLTGARSEKVRADLATEFIRQKVGTPTQKSIQQTEQTITFSLDAPAEVPSVRTDKAIDAEHIMKIPKGN